MPEKNEPFISNLSAEEYNAALEAIQSLKSLGAIEFLQELIDEGTIVANIRTAEAGGSVLESGVLALKDGQLALHDGESTGGNIVGLGLNHYGVAVRVTNDPVQNGLNLLSAYEKAKGLTPGGSPLAEDNRAMVLMPPAWYDLNVNSLTLDAEFVDLVGLSRNREHQKILSQLTTSGTGTIIQTANDVRLSNFVVTRVSGSESDTSAYYPDTDLDKTVCLNIFFDPDGGTSSHAGMRRDIIYSGTFIDCEGRNGSFGSGSSGGVASGVFIRCKAKTADQMALNVFAFGGAEASGLFIECEGGRASFASQGIASGTFIRCEATHTGFASNGGTASGVFRRCKAGNNSFGGDGGVASGTFIFCEGGQSSFGGGDDALANGDFQFCKGGDWSFGGFASSSSGEASGRFSHCIGGEGSFSGYGIASGTFEYCQAGNWGFGGDDGGGEGALTGKLYFCRLTEGGFQTRTGDGIVKLSVDGGNATVDDTP